MASALMEQGMAKAKADSKATSDKAISIVVLKGLPSYRDWIERLADFARLNKQDLIDHGLVDYAKKIGFSEPPPKR